MGRSAGAEFVPARVEVRDFVAGDFQLRLQIENLRARFRIKIRRGKRGLQIRLLDRVTCDMLQVTRWSSAPSPYKLDWLNQSSMKHLPNFYASYVTR
jgi:hypothetical protein